MFLRLMSSFVPVSIALVYAHANPLLIFAVSCIAIIPLADLLAKSTEEVAAMLGPTIGGLLNATLGNAPELIIGGFVLSKGLTGVVKWSIAGSILMNQLIFAIRFARADKMDLAMATTVGAATQAALAVAPLLVFMGLLMGQRMDLLFSTFEVFAISLAVFVTGQLTRDGESNWMEGAMLVVVYLIFAVGFFYAA